MPELAESLSGVGEEDPPLMEKARQNPLIAVLLSAVDDARTQAAMVNQGEYRGSDTGRVMKNYGKDMAKMLPGAFRRAMVNMVAENASIPIGRHTLTAAPSEEHDKGIDFMLSNVLGGDLRFTGAPGYAGAMFTKQF